MEEKEGNLILNKNGEPKKKTPNPHVELSYTYLVAWYVMDYPALMSAVQESNGNFVPFIQELERSKWQGGYMAAIQKIVQSSMNYHLFRCFLDFPEAAYGEKFIDVLGPDGFTSLSLVFSASC